MFIEVITPDKKLFEGAVKVAQLPGSNGSFEILNNHAPIVSTLAKGKLRLVAEDNHEHVFEIGGGVIESADNKIIILAETV